MRLLAPVTPRRVPISFALFVLASCSGGGPEGSAPPDRAAPALSLERPARGTIVEGEALDVSGRAEDGESGLSTVKVQESDAALTEDGRFDANLALAPGISVLQTVAVDQAGNEARDTRAVLAGSFAPVDKPVPDGLTARIGPEALSELAAVAVGGLSELDLAQLVSDDELLDAGSGCFGVEIHLDSIEHGGIGGDLAPSAGGIAFSLEALDVRVSMTADYDVFCIGGDADLRLSASAVRLGGTIGLGIADDGTAESLLSELDVSFDDFDFDFGGLPDDLVELVAGDVEEKAVDAIQSALQSAIPDELTSMLSDFFADGAEFSLFDRDVRLLLRPAEITADESGIFLALDGGLAAAASGASSLSSPSPVPPVMAADPPMAVGIADDVANQLLASLWAVGAFELELDGEPLELLLGGDVETLALSFKLPPVVSVEGPERGLSVMGGDVIAEARSADGGVLLEAALSLSIDVQVAITDEGELRVDIDDAKVWAQVLSQSDDVAEIEDDTLAAMVEAGIRTLEGKLEDALGSLTIPEVVRAALAGPELEYHEGYLVLRTGADSGD